MRRRFVSTILSAFMAVGALAGLSACQSCEGSTDTFVQTINTPSGVFNPLYATVGYDSEIAGMTQIGMLTADANGEYAFGEEYAVVSKDISVIMYDAAGNVTEIGDPDNGRTEYQFVLKNDIVFSDGKPLSIDDVLFTYYSLLDPTYNGLSTLYSTKIKGLAKYRTGNPDAGDDDADEFEENFKAAAKIRIDNLKRYIENGSDTINGASFSVEELAKIRDDFDTARAEFRKQLKLDWNSSLGTVSEMQKQNYPFTQDWECFFFSVGVIWVETDVLGIPQKDTSGKFKIDYNGVKETILDDYNNNFSEENCIEVAYRTYATYTGNTPDKYPKKFVTAISYTSALPGLFAADEKSAKFEELKKDNKNIKFIEGIKVMTGADFRPDGKKSISNTAYSSDYEMLQITINGVDPRAIWNFAITVLPLHYYSGTYKGVDYVAAAKNDKTDKDNFGVDSGNFFFFRDVVQSKNRVPMGAGPYKITTATGSQDKTLAQLEDGFWKDGMVYYERNELFLMGMPQIKYMRYKVLNNDTIMSSVTSGAVHFAMPQASKENVDLVNSLNKTLGKPIMVRTNGYGYIGVSAKHINDINIRKAIMTAMDITQISSYYPGTLAEPLYRPLSLVSWVYDDKDSLGNKIPWVPNPKDFYFVQEEAARETKINNYLTAAGCNYDSTAKRWLTAEGKPLNYTFNVAGDTDNHPAWMVFEKAREFLNKRGWNITVRANSRVLSELAKGNGMQVWAAAWGGTVDPDMYQIYHRSSKAASVNNWGYDWILTQGPSVPEYNIVQNLSNLIEDGRATINVEERKEIYREALDHVMELAVELPVYQRNDMYVFNKNIIDETSLIQNCTPFQGPLDRIWEVRLK